MVVIQYAYDVVILAPNEYAILTKYQVSSCSYRLHMILANGVAGIRGKLFEAEKLCTVHNVINVRGIWHMKLGLNLTTGQSKCVYI